MLRPAPRLTCAAEALYSCRVSSSLPVCGHDRRQVGLVVLRVPQSELLETVQQGRAVPGCVIA